ncbi:MAG: MBL fold metallo-hydrolase [Sulfolobales archaeon]
MSRVIKINSNVYIISTELLNTSDWLSTYLIVGSDGAALVDPGPDVNVKGLMEVIGTEFSDVKIKYVLATHIHLDHGGGLGRLAELLGDVKVYVHPRGVKHLISPNRLWEASKEVLGDVALFFGPPKPLEHDRVVGLEDYSSVDLGGVTIKAIHTPGHAPHHMSFIVEPGSILIAGDALGNLFNGRVYPVTVPPFNFVEYVKSIDKLSQFNYEVVSVAHFGYVRENPEVLIQRVKDKAIAWATLIADLIRRGFNRPEDVYRELLKSDLELRYMVMYREKFKMFEGTTYRAVLGMYQSVKELVESSRI